MEQMNIVEDRRVNFLHRSLISFGAFLQERRYPNLNITGIDDFPEYGVIAVSPHFRERMFFEFVYLAAALRDNPNNLNTQCAIVVKPTKYKWLENIVNILGDKPLIAASSKRKGMGDSLKRREFNNTYFYTPGAELARNMPLLVYPQGQRLDREELLSEKGLRFHPGPAELAMRAATPLVSAVVWAGDNSLTVNIRPIELPHSESAGSSKLDRAHLASATDMMKAHYTEVMSSLL